ncbi:MAG: type IV pilin protein [Bdellovibrionales bacterium]
MLKLVRNQKGFSLIEIVIVMMIIGVLAGVGVPQYTKMKKKAQQSEVKALLSVMYSAQSTFYGEWTQYYGDFNAVGFQVNGDLSYHFGFQEPGVAGPLAHPGAQYNGKPPTTKDTNAFCATSGECNISKTGTLRLVSGTIANTKTYSFGGAADLDADVTLDEWTIDQGKNYTQVSDDISQ